MPKKVVLNMARSAQPIQNLNLSTRSVSLLAFEATHAARITIALLLLLGPCAWGFGQSSITFIDNTTSTPSPGSGHDYIQSLAETVNPANGALTIQVLAPTPKERGMNYPTYAFIYNSNGQYVWTPEYYPSSEATRYSLLLYEVLLTPNQPWMAGSTLTGNLGHGGGPGTLNYTTLSFVASGTGRNSGSNGDYCTFSTSYIYTDSAGGQHAFPSLTNVASPYQTSCSDFGINESNTESDGTFTATLDSNSSGDAYVYDLHGNQVNPDYTIEDTNGNYLNGSGRTYSSENKNTNSPNTLSSLILPGGRYTYTSSTQSIEGGAVPYHPYSPNAIGFSTNNQYCPSGPAAFVQQSSSSNQTTVSTQQVLTIGLPGGESYKILYDPNYSLLPSEIIYPTGATVTYTWGNNHQSDSAFYSKPYSPTGNSDTCGYIYEMPAIQKRVVSYDGVTPALEQDFQYSTTYPAANSLWTEKATTVTTKDLSRPGSPSFNTVYTYSGYQPVGPGSPMPVESSIVYKDYTGNTLKTVYKTWESFFGAPKRLTSECTVLPNNQISGVFYQYEPYVNVVTDKAEYDFGQVSAPCVQPPSSVAPARETITLYQSFPATPIHTFMSDRIASVTLKDHGTTLNQTNYTYDETAVESVPNAIAHDEANYGSGVMTSRGNVTTVTRYCLPNCSNLQTNYGYDETGNLVLLTDPRRTQTWYGYKDAYSAALGSAPGNTNTYLTSITYPSVNGVAQSESFTYGYANGQATSHTDANRQTTSYCYFSGGCNGTSLDPWNRLTEMDNPDGGRTTVSYNDSGPNPSTSVSTVLSASSSEASESIFDAYGHLTRSLITSDPYGIDYVDRKYDGLGHLYSVSNPYRSLLDTTYGTTTYSYDSLDRTIGSSFADGSESTCYDGVANVQVSMCPPNSTSIVNGTFRDSYDSLGHMTQQVSDALGRLSAVLEPTPLAGNLPLETDYSYDATGNLLNVKQKGLSSDSPRTRSFSYDSISRLITSQNPENGTVCYGTQNNSGGCQNGYDTDGNLRYKTDLRGVTTSYSYDVLNRVVQKVVPVVGSSPTTYIVTCYQYDTMSGAPASANLLGHLVAEWTQAGNNCASTYTPSLAITAKVILSYDAMGRPLQSQQCVRAMCTSQPFTQNQTYDLDGNATSWQDGLGWMTFGQQFDSAGRPSSITNSVFGSGWPSVLLSAQGYTTAGALQNWNIGNLLNFNRSYDNRLRVTGETVSH